MEVGCSPNSQALSYERFYNLNLRFYLETNCTAAGKVAGTCGCFAMYLSLPMPLHWMSVLGGQSYVDRSSGVQLRGENGMNECLMKGVLVHLVYQMNLYKDPFGQKLSSAL